MGISIPASDWQIYWYPGGLNPDYYSFAFVSPSLQVREFVFLKRLHIWEYPSSMMQLVSSGPPRILKAQNPTSIIVHRPFSLRGLHTAPGWVAAFPARGAVANTIFPHADNRFSPAQQYNPQVLVDGMWVVPLLLLQPDRR